jgi:hypothetical protein
MKVTDQATTSDAPKPAERPRTRRQVSGLRRTLDDSDPSAIVIEGSGSQNHKRRRRTEAHPSSSCSASSSTTRRRDDKEKDVEMIRTKLGDFKFHGTGNPLAMRSPTMPKTLAVDNLAAIIRSGHLGQEHNNSDSTPQLKTERGTNKEGSFWADRMRLAGKYGWTGLVLPPNADTSKRFPVSEVKWFLVETQEERNQLLSLLQQSSEEAGKNDDASWVESSLIDRIVTISELADISIQLEET